MLLVLVWLVATGLIVLLLVRLATVLGWALLRLGSGIAARRFIATLRRFIAAWLGLESALLGLASLWWGVARLLHLLRTLVALFVVLGCRRTLNALHAGQGALLRWLGTCAIGFGAGSVATARAWLIGRCGAFHRRHIFP